ncbi:hypothetical protein P389DRAFT_178011 [Cystobasidium minutum MCA 4210]|uniref:uncharacterized protein n=1 Tax=Cystobasidium minutum MCA 4210 TaxID=1397322 RepID=UPI0034CE3C63|eukprot:jgi/Rhomi1/178011/fgenesh1_pg.2_\
MAEDERGRSRTRSKERSLSPRLTRVACYQIKVSLAILSFTIQINISLPFSLAFTVAPLTLSIPSKISFTSTAPTFALTFTSKTTTLTFILAFSNVTEKHLEEIFSAYGEIEKVDMPLNRRINAHRGFADIVFQSVDDANKAVAYMDRGQLDGSLLSVNIKRSDSPPPAGGAPPARRPYDDRDRDARRPPPPVYSDNRRGPPEILDHLHREEEILEAVQGAEAGHRQEDESVVREDPARRIDKTATQHASVR